ncbi:MAG: hypothetical protein QM523_04115 [Candidatus Pacebacteria bacterium]|nr:hypothetical protein [Candidatus Paceibacterota bacterium]
MNQKSPPPNWNPKRLLERLFSVADADDRAVNSSAPSPMALSASSQAHPVVQEALKKLQELDLPEGDKIQLDFTAAASHFGSDWQGLKPRAQAMAIRLLVNYYGRDLKYRLTEEGVIFVPQSALGTPGVKTDSAVAHKLVQKILRQIVGGEDQADEDEFLESEDSTSLPEVSASAKAGTTERLAVAGSDSIREGQRSFGLAETPLAVEFAEGWEFSEGAEITNAIYGSSRTIDSTGTIGGRPELAPSVSGVRIVSTDSSTPEVNFAEGWQGKDQAEGERQWLGQSANQTAETIKLRLITEENQQSKSGKFQIIADQIQQIKTYRVGLRFGGLLDLHNDVVTTYIADPAEEIGHLGRSPFNTLISTELSPPRAFALDCLTVDIVGRSFPLLRSEGAQFLLALPINAMTLQRLKLRAKYMERLKRLSEEERNLIRPMIYGLNEITPGRLREILGLLRGIARAPLVRIAPESDNIEVLINEKSFGAMIDGTKYAAQLRTLSSDRTSRLVRYAKNANLKLVLYNPATIQQLQWAIGQGFDYIQIATMESTDEIPRVVTRLDRKAIGL